MATAEYLIPEINNLVNLTRDEKIQWKRQLGNPNPIYRWDRSIGEKNYQIVIQIQNLNTPTEFIFFSVIKVSPLPQEVQLQINTQVNLELKPVLKSLVTTAEISSRKFTENIISDLISGL